MDLAQALNTKQFFKFTGPPEHWLAAFKNMTWGLEMHNKSQWERVQTGDVFFIHSTGHQDGGFPNAKSGIIGIGVVGFHFSIKDNYLWRSEIVNKQNTYPLLVPLAEVYLFADLPDPATWELPTAENDSATARLIDILVKDRIPTSEIPGFPTRSSFSSVQLSVAENILYRNKPLHLLSGHSVRGSSTEERASDLTEVENATETLRHAASLRFIDQINKRIILKPYSLSIRDNDILARAESSHHSILEQLIQIFRDKGYATLSNEFVDLFAHKGNRSFLFEVKSTENKNFRSQARKGIVQLYEYDYFEINKFKKEKEMNFDQQYKILVPSREPKDTEYVSFINSLDLGVATVGGGVLKPIGVDQGFSVI
jgi:hypothetical protein